MLIGPDGRIVAQEHSLDKIATIIRRVGKMIDGLRGPLSINSTSQKCQRGRIAKTLSSAKGSGIQISNLARQPGCHFTTNERPILKSGHPLPHFQNRGKKRPLTLSPELPGRGDNVGATFLAWSDHYNLFTIGAALAAPIVNKSSHSRLLASSASADRSPFSSVMWA